MALNLYQFRSVWQLNATPDAVYGVLVALGEYPRWWREIKEARLLPDLDGADHSYELVFVTHEERQDPVAGVLEGRLVGDLEGFSRWTLQEADGGGTTAVFEEEVIVNKRLLRRLALVARPFFRANHTLMMRNGRRGLETYLSRRSEVQASGA